MTLPEVSCHLGSLSTMSDSDSDGAQELAESILWGNLGEGDRLEVDYMPQVQWCGRAVCCPAALWILTPRFLVTVLKPRTPRLHSSLPGASLRRAADDTLSQLLLYAAIA